MPSLRMWLHRRCQLLARSLGLFHSRSRATRMRKAECRHTCRTPACGLTASCHRLVCIRRRLLLRLLKRPVTTKTLSGLPLGARALDASPAARAASRALVPVGVAHARRRRRATHRRSLSQTSARRVRSLLATRHARVAALRRKRNVMHVRVSVKARRSLPLQPRGCPWLLLYRLSL